MRIPEDALFLRAAFSLRRRSSSSLRSSLDMRGPHFSALAPLYRCWPDICSRTIAVAPIPAEAIASRRWLRQCIRDVRALTKRLPLRTFEAECLGGRKIDDEVKFRGLLDR